MYLAIHSPLKKGTNMTFQPFQMNPTSSDNFVANPNSLPPNNRHHRANSLPPNNHQPPSISSKNSTPPDNPLSSLSTVDPNSILPNNQSIIANTTPPND